MYVAVKGGEKAIANAHQLQADLRRGAREVAELGCDQVAQQLHGQVFERCGEGERVVGMVRVVRSVR